LILRAIKFSYVAALLLAVLGYGIAPAAAQCAGCFAAPQLVHPYAYPSCSCCGCGSAYYGSYYGAHAYPSYGYAVYAGCGGCGYGGGYGYGVGYAGYDLAAPVVAVPIYPRPYYRGYRAVRRWWPGRY